MPISPKSPRHRIEPCPPPARRPALLVQRGPHAGGPIDLRYEGDPKRWYALTEEEARSVRDQLNRLDLGDGFDFEGGYLAFVFDGPPNVTPPALVEVEDGSGVSRSIGTWVARGEHGWWDLRITKLDLLQLLDRSRPDVGGSR